MKLTIIVPVWGELRWLLSPCLLSLKNHWPGLVKEHLIVLADEPIELPLPADCLVYPEINQDFSGALKNSLIEIENRIVFFICVDYFFLGPLDSAALRRVAKYINLKPNIFRGNIKDEPALIEHHKFIESWAGIDFVKCDKWEHCSLIDAGLSPALFKKDLLIELLRPNWNLQETETQLIQMIHKTEFYGVGTIPALGRCEEIHRSSVNDKNYWHLDLLEPDDKELIRQYQPNNICWS